MTDEELIARLRDACRGGETCKCSLNEAADRIEALLRERDEAKAMQACGCAYDTPTDICLGHPALFERVYASRIEALVQERDEARLAKVKNIPCPECQGSRTETRETCSDDGFYEITFIDCQNCKGTGEIVPLDEPTEEN